MLEVCGPPSWRFLLTPDGEIDAAMNRLKSAFASKSQNELQSYTQSSQYAADRSLVVASVHPDSLEPILWPFRMSAHVPMNTILLLGMLGSTSVAGSAFWQFANQTFNAGQFYANRNASNAVSDAELTASYLASVSTSLGVAVALRRRFARSPATTPLGRACQLFTPLLAAAAAKPLQIACMRIDELTRGVKVYGPSGHEAGESQIAGALGVSQTIATRILYLAQPMIIPPLLMLRVDRAAWARQRPLARHIFYVLFVGAMSAVATPMCVALFDQQASVSTAWLEPRLQGQRDPITGQEIHHVTFNRGL